MTNPQTLEEKTVRLFEEPSERFFNSIEILTNGCWQWNKSLLTNGYGKFSIRGNQFMAHRFSYWLFKGDIPEGLQLDHLCRNRGCVNPDHLEAVTVKENILRGVGFGAINTKKTHCLRGHEFNAVNTLVRKGGRYCRACNRLYWYRVTRPRLRAIRHQRKQEIIGGRSE